MTKLTLNMWALLVLAVAASVAFTACGDDDAEAPDAAMAM